jgi:hypothetical protein
LAIVIVGMASSCKGPAPNESRPGDKHISMPESPERDARAREIAAKPLQILAEKIEIYLPPGVYAEVACEAQNHTKDEYNTGAGRRIALAAPAVREAGERPARVRFGSWDLAARGRIDVLFVTAEGGPAVRVKATGVELLVRDQQSRRGLPEVDVENDVVTTPGVR